MCPNHVSVFRQALYLPYMFLCAGSVIIAIIFAFNGWFRRQSSWVGDNSYGKMGLISVLVGPISYALAIISPAVPVLIGMIGFALIISQRGVRTTTKAKMLFAAGIVAALLVSLASCLL